MFPDKDNKYYWGMHLTPTTTICSILDHGRELPQDIDRDGRPLQHRGCLPGIFTATTVARRLPLPTLRGKRGLASASRALSLSTVWLGNIGYCRHHPTPHTQAIAVVVSGYVAYNQPEVWGQCSRLAEGDELGQLSYGLAMAAQKTAACYGAVAPGPAERND